MKLRLLLLTAAIFLVACSDPPPAESTTEPKPERECRYHVKLRDCGLNYNADEILGLSGIDSLPIWLYHGTLQKYGEQYILQVNAGANSDFIVLVPNSASVVNGGVGLDPLIGWKTIVIGRYTSRDITPPAIPGALGTVRADAASWLSDPERPRGPLFKLDSALPID